MKNNNLIALTRLDRTGIVFGGLLCLVFSSLHLNAQNLEGRIRYLRTSNWTKQMSALDYISPQQRAKIEYMWGSRSEWKMYTELYFSPTLSKYQDSDEKAEADAEGYNWRKDVYYIQRDFSAGLLSDAIEMLGKTYLVQDSMHCPDWKILNDMKEVAGHVCMNAFWVDTLKDQRIIAWFALDLPLSAGPERLCGLPGIILEVDVNDGALSIVADRIELAPPGAGLDMPKKLKGKKVKEAEYQAVIARFIREKRQREEPWFWGLRY